MIRSAILLSGAMLAISATTQARGLLHTFYGGVSGGVHYDMSQNSGFNIGVDRTTAARGYNFAAQIGVRPFKYVFFEAGIGVYSVAQSFSTANFFSRRSDYKNRVQSAGWTSVPIKLGYQMVSRPKYSIACFAGAQLLADRIRSMTHLLLEAPKELEAKDPGSRPPANSEVYLTSYRNEWGRTIHGGPARRIPPQQAPKCDHGYKHEPGHTHAARWRDICLGAKA